MNQAFLLIHWANDMDGKNDKYSFSNPSNKRQIFPNVLRTVSLISFELTMEQMCQDPPMQKNISNKYQSSPALAKEKKVMRVLLNLFFQTWC